MSEMQSFKGKLVKVIPNEGESFQELCKRISITNHKAKEKDYYDNYLFDEIYPTKYTRANDTLYEVVDLVEEDPDKSHCNIIMDNTANKKELTFDARFWNGGMGLGEILKQTLEKHGVSNK